MNVNEIKDVHLGKDTMKSIRLERGWTQQDVADKLGITKASYANIEKGVRNPSLKTALKISKLFQLPIDIFAN